jgi:Zn-dependent protease
VQDLPIWTLFVPITLFILLLFALREILSQRAVEWLRLEITEDWELPESWQMLFKQKQTELEALGFERLCLARVEHEPASAFAPSVTALFLLRSEGILARVTPPQVHVSHDRWSVTLLSRGADGALIACTDHLPEAFPRPDQRVVRGLAAQAIDLADQLGAHRRMLEMESDPVERWQDAEQAVTAINAFERWYLQWLVESGLVRANPAGGYNPSLRGALGILWRALRGRVNSGRMEAGPLPADQQALLYRQWLQFRHLSPVRSVQWGLFLLTGVAFALLAAGVWDLQIGLVLMLVILFHELGHLLAMRWLGYHNLQILMLPLLGGVAIGSEISPSAANRAFVSLMGPLPGILLGWLMLAVIDDVGGFLWFCALLLLLVNYFNLLPILPLDGGRLIQALLPGRWVRWQFLLPLASAVLLLMAGINHQIFILLAIFAGIIAWHTWSNGRVTKNIQASGTLKSAEDPVAAIIRGLDEQSVNYRPLLTKANQIRELAENIALRPASPAVRNLLFSGWLLAFLLPALLVPGFSGWFSFFGPTVEAPETRLETLWKQLDPLTWEELLREVDYTYSTRGSLKYPPVQDVPADLPAEYRAFLTQSNGLGRTGGVEGYWVLPFEQVRLFREYSRFGELTRKPAPWLSPGRHFSHASHQLEWSELGNWLWLGQGGPHNTLILLEPESGGRAIALWPDSAQGELHDDFREWLEGQVVFGKLRKEHREASMGDSSE